MNIAFLVLGIVLYTANEIKYIIYQNDDITIEKNTIEKDTIEKDTNVDIIDRKFKIRMKNDYTGKYNGSDVFLKRNNLYYAVYENERVYVIFGNMYKVDVPNDLYQIE